MVCNLNQNEMPLLRAMKEYADRDVTAFDVPGHKRGRGVPILNDFFGDQLMRLDTNSLPVLDNVGNPTGVIKEAQDLLADAYGADEAFFVTNGSTSVIHTMLMAVLNPGDKILMPKNIHKSALNGLILCGATPVYMRPETCVKEGLTKNVTIAEVQRCLDEHSDAKAVFVLNPTYFGHVSDLEKIGKLCHERGVLLLADEAHGSHFPFHDELPKSAMECGVDISCISIHKGGGSLTQSSALLLRTKRVDPLHIKRVKNILQSTSVSYLLMGSLDGARYNLVQNGKVQLSQAISLSNEARSELNKIASVRAVVEKRFYDSTKLVINVSGLSLTGFEVYEKLWQEYAVQLELCETNHVLAIISLGDSTDDIRRLVESIADLAARFPGSGKEAHLLVGPSFAPVAQLMSPRDAYFAEKELIPFAQAVGRVAGESIMAYPPGIPIISQGEEISGEVVRNLKELIELGAFIVDNADPKLEQVLVVKK